MVYGVVPAEFACALNLKFDVLKTRCLYLCVFRERRNPKMVRRSETKLPAKCPLILS